MDGEKEELLAQYKKLPKDLQDVIASSDVDKAIADIAKKHNLHIDQAGELSDEIGLVLLGIVHPGDFMKDIESRLRINRDQARTIVSDVNTEIFKRVRHSLMKIHSIENAVIPDEMINPVVQPPPKNEEAVSREEMLREIEKPHTPAGGTPKPPVPAPSPVSFAAPREKPAVGQSQTPPISARNPSLRNVVEKKMSGSFGVPPVETAKPGSEAPGGAPENAKKAVDPYREPIE